MLYIRISIIGCLLPCTKTKIRTVYINEKVFDRRNISRVELIFSRSVKRKIYSFPHFNFFTFLTSIGGTAGLWLGLGIIQVSEYLATFMNPRMKILLRKSKKWTQIIFSFFYISCLLFNIFLKKWKVWMILSIYCPKLIFNNCLIIQQMYINSCGLQTHQTGNPQFWWSEFFIDIIISSHRSFTWIDKSNLLPHNLPKCITFK